MACRLFAIIWKKAGTLLIAPMRTNFSDFGNLNQNTTTQKIVRIYILKCYLQMTAILSSLGCVKDYTTTQPNIFSINSLQ